MKSKKWSQAKNLGSIKSRDKHTLKEFLKNIDLNKPKLKKIEALLAGYFQSKVSGTGFDFNEIREYKMGDDLRHISWKSTAKTGKLQTKEYFAEKEIRAYFLIDISTSMFCATKLEPLINLLAFLLYKSQNFCEKIGGVFFSNDIYYHFPISHTNAQANLMFETFFDYFAKLKDKTPDYPVFTDLVKATNFTKQYFKRKGVIFIVSDFINLKNWQKSIFDLSQKQNIYSFQIYDPVDFNLSSSGYITFIDPETKERCFVNTDNKLIMENYYKLMNKKQEELNSFLMSQGVKHFIIEKEDFI